MQNHACNQNSWKCANSDNGEIYDEDNEIPLPLEVYCDNDDVNDEVETSPYCVPQIIDSLCLNSWNIRQENHSLQATT